MTHDQWLETHAYLRPIAELSAHVARAAAEIAPEFVAIPDWDDYRADFLAGVPLLLSGQAVVDLEPGGRMAAALIERLASSASPAWLVAQARVLDADLRSAPHAARRIADFVLGDEAVTPPSAGLLRYLAWTAMERYLRPLLPAFAGWRDEDRWLHRYCPTCGSSPAMAQLAGADPGRKRLLCCGGCRTRWQFKRTGCPFCASESAKLTSLTIASERGLRIDFCESCRGYLKTYDGEGDEALWLADWTSLHLDLLAQDRGLKKLASSLYEFEFEPAHQS
jgi:FdhE protein